jgi:hypothetical protein
LNETPWIAASADASLGRARSIEGEGFENRFVKKLTRA